MRYRRILRPGAIYFFTLNLSNRNSNLLIQEIKSLLFALNTVRKNHPFNIDAQVVLPDHWHLVMTLPEGDIDYAKRLRLIKATFSRQIKSQEYISASRKKKRERGIWQRRYWEHLIRDEHDYEQHINYIHFNPVKHGYVKKPNDWAYSSIHRFIAKGIISDHWTCDEKTQKILFGE